MQYNLWNYDKFDLIWASPPCQTHSQCNNFLHAQGVRRYADMKLWQLILYLEKWANYNDHHIEWVVENPKVSYEPLRAPSFIVGRHWFWSNCLIPSKKFKGLKRNLKDIQLPELCEYLGVNIDLLNELNLKNWPNHDGKRQILRNCVHPEIGKYVLDEITKKRQLTLEVFS